MSWKTLLAKLTARNSLLLAYDHLDDAGMVEFESQIAEVGKYYCWNFVSGILQNLKAGKLKNEAGVIFRNPRKSVVLRAVPHLMGLGIPFTICLRTDCIGLNRLPPEEELALYGASYPELSDTLFKKENDIENLKMVWERPDEAENFLRGLRSTVGPLPIPTLDPTRFFSTWGNLSELDKKSVEWGVSLYTSAKQRRRLDDGILFMRQQLGVVPKIGALARSEVMGFAGMVDWTIDDFAAMGLEGCMGLKSGAITKVCDCYDLPAWNFHLEKAI